MSSATSGEPPTPFSQKYTPTNLLDDWEVEVSCIPGRKARTEKLFALVEKTDLMHGKIYRALRNEIEHPSLSSETFCQSFIKLHNELIHLRIVKRTESFLRDRDDYNRMDRQGYDPESDAYEMQVRNALGEPPHRIYDDIQPISTDSRGWDMDARLTRSWNSGFTGEAPTTPAIRYLGFRRITPGSCSTLETNFLNRPADISTLTRWFLKQSSLVTGITLRQ